MLAVIALFGMACVVQRAAATACPDTDPRAIDLLQKMADSAQRAQYQGVVTLQRGDDLQIMQLSHSVGGGAESEYLTRLTGQGARVERKQHPLDCVHPGHKLLQVSAQLQAGHCGVLDHYQFTVDDGERVAGRRAVRLRVRPRDIYRYGYVMELDPQTGLLLKALIVDEAGRVLERYQFANLNYRGQAADPEDVEVVHEAAHPHPSLLDEEPPAGRDWVVGWVPGGFTPTDTPAGSSARRSYTDGMAVFSVFLEELAAEMRPGEGVARHGGTTSYTRGLRMGGSPVLVTVIGEVPVNTARMVADSVAWTR